MTTIQDALARGVTVHPNGRRNQGIAACYAEDPSNALVLEQALSSLRQCESGGCLGDCLGQIKILHAGDFGARDGELTLRWGDCARKVVRLRQARIDGLLRSARRPAALSSKSFSNFEATAGTGIALGAVQQALTSKRSLVLAGSPGTGKTHLGAAFGNARLAKGFATLFAVWPELLDDLREAVREDGGARTLKEVEQVGNLVLDDVGSERVTPFVCEQAFRIVNARLLNQRQTIITTNLETPTALLEHFGGGNEGRRIVSRLREMADWVLLEGPDFRLRSL